MDTLRLLKNRYRLVRVIGRGGMGVVWLATDEVLDRSVAVKEVVFPPGLPEEEHETLRRRTLREARTNARLNHPNVVGLFDIVDEENRPWIVMEFVPSRSLAEVVRAEGSLTPRRTAEIGLQLLAGLRAAHAAGVLHRDVKPSNVLLADDGRVVLGDFGIATAEGGSSVTSSGVLIGSPSYMAPERARGRDVGPESDLWSLGATLYTAVEGRPPFDRDSAVATLAALVMDEPDQPGRAGPLWPLIRGLLRRDPAERPTAEAVAADLREIAEGAPAASAARPSAGGYGPPPVPRPRTALDESPSLDGPDPGTLETPEPPADEAALDEPTPDGAAPDGSAPGRTESGAGAETDDATGHVSGPAHPAGAMSSSPPATGTVRTPARESPAPHRRRNLAILLTAVVVLCAAVLAWAVTDLSGGDHSAGSGHRTAGHASAGPGHSASRRQTTSPSAPATSPSAPPAGSPAKPSLPGGYHWHHDGTGFTIAVPDGWSATHHGHYLYVEDPHSSRILIVDQTDTPKPDPLKDWREQEAARRSGYSGYHRIRLEAVDYPPAQEAADWEFTYNGSGGRNHVLNRNILASKKRAYALYWSAPDSRWKSSRSIFDAFAATFQPATG